MAIRSNQWRAWHLTIGVRLIACAVLLPLVALAPPSAMAQRSCPELNRVPNLLGLPLQRAEAALGAVCLRLGRVEARASDEPNDMVLQQQPRRGAYLEPGAPVDVVVSERPEVPELRGLRLDEAERVLGRANLRLGRIEERFADVRPETVLEQRPPPREPLPQNGRVDVAIAMAPIVPDLYGLTLDRAEQELENRYLALGRVETVRASEPDGTIVRQRPRPGDELRPRERVDVEVAEAPTVPDLRGLTQRAAEPQLRERGLRLGPVESRIADGEPGTIVEQRPAPGQRADSNEVVSIVIAEAPTVPDLHGHTLERAQELLREQSLRLGRSTREISAEPAGTIVGQRPGPGERARFGGAVEVRVAEAPVVPDLVGRRIDQAGPLVERQLLELREGEQRFSKEPPGTIIDQTPAAGTAAEAGAVVEVVTAQPLPVPDLRGLALDAAESLLVDSDLGLGEITEVVADAAPGTVLAQAPASGALALPGETVAVRVAKAPEVPDLRGLRTAEARAALAGQMLALGDLGYEAAPEPPLTILRQDPAPGTSASASDRVDVVLAATPPPPTRPGRVGVPELLGEAIAAAAQAAEDAGLALELTNPPAEKDVPGVVREQTPAAGTLLPVGSTVRVTAEWIEQVAPPELEGLQLVEAQPLLRELFLQTGRVEYLPARAEPGTIIDQRPAPGVALVPGAPIDLVVARPPAVPSLLGMRPERADAVLESELLRLGRVEQVFSADWPGTIVEQTPPAGAAAEPDDVVHVEVASALAPLTVGGSFLLALVVAAFTLRRSGTSGTRRAGAPALRVVVGRDPGLQDIEKPPSVALAGPRLSVRSQADAGRQAVNFRPEDEQHGRDAPHR